MEIHAAPASSQSPQLDISFQMSRNKIRSPDSARLFVDNDKALSGLLGIPRVEVAANDLATTTLKHPETGKTSSTPSLAHRPFPRTGRLFENVKYQYRGSCYQPWTVSRITLFTPCFLVCPMLSAQCLSLRDHLHSSPRRPFNYTRLIQLFDTSTLSAENGSLVVFVQQSVCNG